MAWGERTYSGQATFLVVNKTGRDKKPKEFECTVEVVVKTDNAGMVLVDEDGKPSSRRSSPDDARAARGGSLAPRYCALIFQSGGKRTRARYDGLLVTLSQRERSSPDEQ